MTYYVRNKQGVVVAKMNSVQAGRFINSFRGEWQPKSFTNGCKVNAFVVQDDDNSWGNDNLAIFIDKGTYIYAA